MRVPNEVHQAHPWVIARIAPDFELLDVWALPVRGDADGFAEVVEYMAGLRPDRARFSLSGVLFGVRMLLGRVFGWDRDVERPIPGCEETTLRARLPEELRGSADHPKVAALQGGAGAGFVPLYRTHDEWAAEISNDTVHGVLHVSWAPQPAGDYVARLAVYVKPRGRRGRVYLKLIDPFRHYIVYPGLIRRVGRIWEEREAAR